MSAIRALTIYVQGMFLLMTAMILLDIVSSLPRDLALWWEDITGRRKK